MTKSRNANTVRMGRRSYEVQERVRIRGRKILLLERLATRPRERWSACDPSARFQPRLFIRLPKDSATDQHLRCLSRLSNESLPRICDYERTAGEILVSLTWVRGIDLHTYLERVQANRTPTPSVFHCVRLIRPLAHALNRLHHVAGVIHGDIKPANLVLTPRRTKLVLIDYGCAWTQDRTAWRDPGDGVSPGYAAPEVQSEECGPVGVWSDQFSTSCVLFELLTGVIPYCEVGGQAGLPEYAHELADRLEPPSQHSADLRSLPRRLRGMVDQLVCRGLALKPEDRFPSSAAWLDEVERVYWELQVARNVKRLPILPRVLNWFIDLTLPRQAKHDESTAKN